MAGKESDLDTARKTWNDTLPSHFDYLEGALEGNEYFVGGAFSARGHEGTRRGVGPRRERGRPACRAARRGSPGMRASGPRS